MALQLYFNGQAVGDGVTKLAPGHQLLTPATRRIGLWQDFAGYDSESRNQLRTLIVFIHAKRSSEIAFAQLASAVMELQGLPGDWEIKEGATRRLFLPRWCLDIVAPPELEQAMGGRFVTDWPLTLIGENPAVWS